MSKRFIFIPFCLLFLVSEFSAQYDISTVDLLEVGTYIWDGLKLGHTIINVTAENFCISVTIATCDIGNMESRPNEEYLILKQGHEDATPSKDGTIFAYITKPKKLYFYSSSVILELKTPTTLTKKCTVIFEKADEEATTLPPATTTEIPSTAVPDIIKYSTVFISGRSIDEYDSDLILKLKQNLVDMASKYTQTEGFCLKREIRTDDIDIDVLEQCPSKLADFENCVRMVYAIPVNVNEDCSLWKGYQMTREHLDIMWSKMANTYLENGLQVYTIDSIHSVLTWWIIVIVVSILLLVGATITLNLIWKRRQMLKRGRSYQNEDFMPDTIRVSDVSLTPPNFQSIPPMFDKMHSRGGSFHSQEKRGTDNEGFQYDVIPDCE